MQRVFPSIFLGLCVLGGIVSSYGAPAPAPVPRKGDGKKAAKDREKKEKEHVKNVKRCVDRLKKAGYEVTVEDVNSRNSLLARFAANGNTDAVKIWIDCKLSLDGYADVNANRKTALTLAIENGHDKIAHLLIKAGAVPYFPSATINSLSAAAKAGNVAIAKELLEHGADVNEREGGLPPSNMTPLMYSVKNPEMVQALLDAGADVKVVDSEKHTALHFAANWKSPEAVSMLIEKGANPNAQDALGYTPLFYAVKNDDPHCVKALLTGGTDVTIKGRDGKPAGAFVNQETGEGVMIFALIYDAAKKQGALP